MGVLQRGRRLGHHVARQRDRQRPPVPDQGLKILALHVLHRQKARAVHFIGVVGQNDVGVLQLRERPHFALEPALGEVLILRGRPQHLERHDSAHDGVVGLENLAHPAAAQLVEQAVLTQHEPARRLLQQHSDLEPGQQPLGRQGLGEGAGRRLAPLPRRERGDGQTGGLPQLLRRQQATLSQPLQELLLVHARPSPGRAGQPRPYGTMNDE